jgi:hypothetical protein
MFSGEFRFVSESVNPAKKARQRRVNLRVPEGGAGSHVSETPNHIENGGVGYSVSCRLLSSSTLFRATTRPRLCMCDLPERILDGIPALTIHDSIVTTGKYGQQALSRTRKEIKERNIKGRIKKDK